MARTHPHKPDALKAVQSGEDPRTVSDRLGIPWGTMRVWVSRWRKGGKLTPVTAPATPSNVVTLPQKVRPVGKTKDPEARTRKREKGRASYEQDKADRRARAIPAVDKPVLRRIARRLVGILDAGLMCPSCAPEVAQPLTPGEFHLYTKSYVQHLDSLGRSLELEGTLSEVEETDEEGIDTPEGRAALADALVQIGPRMLSTILQDSPAALKAVEAAVSDALRRTG